MEHYPEKIQITNENLVAKVVERISLAPQQKDLLIELVNNEPRFRERVAAIYRVLNLPDAENQKSGLALLEVLQEDLKAMLE